MVKVEMENLCKYFEDVKAVEDLDIKVGDGEFLTFLGPSGCGKTTTLRMIAGLETPTEGRIFFDGEDVTDLSPRDRNVAMVFQEYALYPHLTAFENIAFPLENLDDVEVGEKEKKVREIAELLKIPELLDRKPKELSGGQRQRIALGRAIVRDPSVFLLDEPLANLDAKLRIEMRSELKEMQSKLGISTVYVTHDQVEAMTMADRIAVLKNGELVQVSGPNELYSQPENTWVATFIGNPGMNVLDCSLREEGDEERVLDGGEFKITIGKELADLIERKNESSELNVGVRPDELGYKKKEPKATENYVEGDVGVLEPIGNAMIVNVRVGDRTIKIKTGVESPPEPGEKIYLVFDVDSLFFFDNQGELIESAA